ncbi:uncharacterized protein METZ01_LOCUS337967, partial [marine metagenome]
MMPHQHQPVTRLESSHPVSKVTTGYGGLPLIGDTRILKRSVNIPEHIDLHCTVT